MFYAGAKYTNNIQETNQSFTTYNSILQLYIPLVYKFSLSLRGGITTITGTPEFFQYASIGGGQNLRGFVRDRFWGQTAFYNTNELRGITDFHTYIMNGKLGLIGFVDDGRVWMPNETSDKIHIGYGGGIILAPFNKFSVSLTYGISEESKLFQLKLNKLFFKQ
jgi:hemolysin activation/secretion protein